MTCAGIATGNHCNTLIEKHFNNQPDNK